MIPRLYRLAKQRKTTMTALVHALLEKALAELEQEASGKGQQAMCENPTRKRGGRR